MTALPPASRALDRATGAVGAVVLLVVLLTPGWTAVSWSWLALPLIIAAGRRPLTLPTQTSSESLVIGLDSSLLILLGLTVPVHQALVVWAVSIAVGELTNRTSLDTRLFNAGVCVLSGLVALPVLASVSDGARSAPRALLAAVLAASLYFAVDYVWSAVSIATAEQAPVIGALRAQGLPLAFACFVGVDSLGVLGAVVLHTQPWAIMLLAVPFGALLVASHAWSQQRAAEQRGAHMSAAVVALQHAATTDDVERLLLEVVPALLRAPSAQWSEGGAPDDKSGLVASFHGRDLVVSRRITASPFSDQERRTLGSLLGVAEQAHQRLQLLAELRRSAGRDPLTGLANRTVFRDALLAATGTPAVLFCDLDRFKQLNDSRGHASGDALLEAVAGRLRAATRPEDVVARFGGDEFAVLLTDLDDDRLAQATAIAERLSGLLGEPYELAGDAVHVTASVGLCLRDADQSPDELLHAADVAMYAAKAAGGDRVHVHAPLVPAV